MISPCPALMRAKYCETGECVLQNLEAAAKYNTTEEKNFF